MADVKLPLLVNKTESIQKDNIYRNDRKESSIEKLPDINYKIEQSNKNNLYSHGNNTSLTHYPFPNNKNNGMEAGNPGNKKDLNSMDNMEKTSKHSPKSQHHALFPTHQQDSGISLSSADNSVQNTDFEHKPYLDENYDEWFLPDQYADYKSEKIKSLTKSLIEMTKKDTNSLKSDNSFVIDTNDTTPEEANYLKSASAELGSSSNSKSSQKTKKPLSTESKKNTNLHDVEDRVARLMAYLNRHVPDEDIVPDSDTSLRVKIDTDISSSEVTASKISIVNSDKSSSVVKIHAKESKELLPKDIEQELSETKTKKVVPNSKTTQKTKNILTKPRQTNTVIKRNLKIQEEKTEKKIMPEKKKERDYFQPIHAPAIPPVRHAKAPPSHSNKSLKSKTNATKLHQNSQRAPQSYLRRQQVVREPPTTIRYPSREEVRLARERQEQESRTTSCDQFSTTSEHSEWSTFPAVQIDRKNANGNKETVKETSQLERLVEKVFTKDQIDSEVKSPEGEITEKELKNMDNMQNVKNNSVQENNLKIETKTQKDEINCKENADSDCSKETISVNDLEKPSEGQSEPSQEELENMETLLRISEKCFVRKSRANVKTA